MVPRPPSVDDLAGSLDDGILPRALLVEIARAAIDRSRRTDETAEAIARDEIARVARSRPGRVINATGVLLHTNLGRAVAADASAEAARMAATAYSALEMDLGTGRRGGRGAYTQDLLCALTGAEAALAVNNNAGALFLTVSALAAGEETVVSRGELIEIGGSFRLPELMAATGTRLVEVGTTNRTRIEDYSRAIGPDTALILKVHPSNYRVEGFSAEASYHEIADLAAANGVPMAADVGSGLLDARVPWLTGPPPAWLEDEPAVRQTLAAGASLVLFSGDKLLGGPQAGIVVGKGALVDVLRSHPVARATRISGPALAALATTLESYASGRGEDIPFWRMASKSADDLARRCGRVAAAVPGATVEEGVSLPGAGSVPGRGIPSPVIVAAGAGDEAWRRLLSSTPPIVARRDPRGLILDLRAVAPDDDTILAQAVAGACRS